LNRAGFRAKIAGGIAGTFRVLVDGRRAHFHVVTPALVVATIPRRARSGRITVLAWGGRVTRRVVLRLGSRR
jgi:hypothetical protein